jgi:Domain of unknown function (DUF4398)
MIRIALWSFLAIFLVAACGGAPVPNDRVVSATAAVRGAEVGGANNNPQAALMLKHAKDGLAKAKALIADGDNEHADWVLRRAEADANLALYLSREASAKAQAQAALDQVRALRQQDHQ